MLFASGLKVLQTIPVFGFNLSCCTFKEVRRLLNKLLVHISGFDGEVSQTVIKMIMSST